MRELRRVANVLLISQCVLLTELKAFDVTDANVKAVVGGGSNPHAVEPLSHVRIASPGQLAFDQPHRVGLYFTSVNDHTVRHADIWSDRGRIIAGLSEPGFSGDGGRAVDARLNHPQGVCVDIHTNIFIADTLNHRIRRVDAETQIITTYAGNGVAGFSGDGGPAVAAELNMPWHLTMDANGVLYFCDRDNHRVRSVDTNGVISTVAGDGNSGMSGDGSTAVLASLSHPRGIVLLPSQDQLLVSDSQNHRVREIDLNTGLIRTIAGTGMAGNSPAGLFATNAALHRPEGLAIGGAGDIYVADVGNDAIRRIDDSGRISTPVGLGSPKNTVVGGPAGLAIGLFDRVHFSQTRSNTVSRFKLLSTSVREIEPLLYTTIPEPFHVNLNSPVFDEEFSQLRLLRSNLCVAYFRGLYQPSNAVIHPHPDSDFFFLKPGLKIHTGLTNPHASSSTNLIYKAADGVVEFDGDLEIADLRLDRQMPLHDSAGILTGPGKSYYWAHTNSANGEFEFGETDVTSATVWSRTLSPFKPLDQGGTRLLGYPTSPGPVRAVFQDHAHRLVVQGSIDAGESVDFGNGMVVTSTNPNQLVSVTYGAGGVPLSVTRIPASVIPVATNALDLAYVRLDDAGNIYSGGGTRLRKFDSDGNELWSKDDVGLYFLNRRGTVYVFWSRLDAEAGPPDDRVIAELDSDGNEVWCQVAERLTPDVAYGAVAVGYDAEADCLYAHWKNSTAVRFDGVVYGRRELNFHGDRFEGDHLLRIRGRDGKVLSSVNLEVWGFYSNIERFRQGMNTAHILPDGRKLLWGMISDGALVNDRALSAPPQGDGNSYQPGRHGFVTYMEDIPVFGTHPVGQSEDAGGTVTLEALAGGTKPINYHWFKDGTLVGSGPSLTINNVSHLDDGLYEVRATNRVGSDISQAVRVVVRQAPSITRHPQSKFGVEIWSRNRRSTALCRGGRLTADAGPVVQERGRRFRCHQPDTFSGEHFIQ